MKYEVQLVRTSRDYVIVEVEADDVRTAKAAARKFVKAKEEELESPWCDGNVTGIKTGYVRCKDLTVPNLPAAFNAGFYSSDLDYAGKPTRPLRPVEPYTPGGDAPCPDCGGNRKTCGHWPTITLDPMPYEPHHVKLDDIP